MHETPNRGTILKPRSLWTEEQPTGHRVSSISMGMKWKVWTRGPHKHLTYGKQFPMRGIMFEIYPRERGIHIFQAPLTIQEHGDDFNKEFTISTISSYISFNDSFFRVHLSETFSAVMQELSGSWRNPTLWLYLSRWSHLWQSTLHRFNPAWIQQHDPQTHHLEYHCLDKP